MVSKEVVIPVETGVHGIYKSLKILDSGFRRNDGKERFQTFGEIIRIRSSWTFFGGVTLCAMRFSA
jgi:hypothetical protein